MNRVEQKELLRELLEELREEGRPVAYRRSYYAEAKERCDAYADSLRKPGQDYAINSVCALAARELYKNKHGIRGKALPQSYIKNQVAADEYFAMFRDFADIYQRHWEPFI